MDSKHKKVKIFAFDESRFGLIGTKRRRITLKGVKPVSDFQYEYKSFWLYGAFDVLSGENYFWEFNHLTKSNFSHFVKEVSNEYSDSVNIILLDNSKTHFLEHYPENIKFIYIEPYAPELNPAERVWQYLKDKLAWLVFENLEALYKYVSEKITQTAEDIYKSLISYPYIVDAIHELNIM